MSVLVFIESTKAGVSRDSLGVLSRAVALYSRVCAIMVGAFAHDDVGAVLQHGAERIYVAAQDDPQPSAEDTASILAEASASNDHALLLFSQSPLGVMVAARAAGALNAGLLWNITELFADGSLLRAHRTTLNDSLLIESSWVSQNKVGLIRQGAFEAHETSIRGEVITIPWLERAQRSSRQIDFELNTSTENLQGAKIVVSGGRGLGKRENLDLVLDLADSLGGVAGVTLPLVDQGWAPRAMQVGQTGTQVRPQLYIACGISGQFQHRIGMERAGTIVAINTDRHAPIMSFADLAVVGDVREILPELIKQIRRIRGLPAYSS
jgi:electron transfer flavoprotein alpha subunit